MISKVICNYTGEKIYSHATFKERNNLECLKITHKKMESTTYDHDVLGEQ